MWLNKTNTLCVPWVKWKSVKLSGKNLSYIYGIYTIYIRIRSTTNVFNVHVHIHRLKMCNASTNSLLWHSAATCGIHSQNSAQLNPINRNRDRERNREIGGTNVVWALNTHCNILRIYCSPLPTGCVIKSSASHRSTHFLGIISTIRDRMPSLARARDGWYLFFLPQFYFALCLSTATSLDNRGADHLRRSAQVSLLICLISDVK